MALADGTHDLADGKLALVVTHLEMLSPAPLKGAALQDGITFRKITPDLVWYRDVFDRVGAPWLWTGRRILSDDALATILNDPNVDFYTLEKDGRSEALMELDFRLQGQCELAYFGLSDRLIGSGAGRYLMDRAIQNAWSKPIKRFYVHTCNGDSQQAPDFYVRSGFVPYKRQVEIEDDPRLTGVIPRDVALHVPLIG
jgi:N-acetylglutamate synthase-like GNAT family acetyltransferase